MRMSELLKVNLIAAVILCGTSAFALIGNADGGGGKGVVCRSKTGKVQSVELLDLWEAREIHDLKLQKPKHSGAALIESAVQSLSQSMRTDEFKWIYNGTNYSGAEALQWAMRTQVGQFLPTPGTPRVAKTHYLRNAQLTLTNDSYEPARPANCQVEQLVHYEDSDYLGGNILLNLDLLEKMDIVNKSALIVHEALYKVLRGQYGESNSLRVRRLVGLAFSGHKFSSLNDANLPSEYYVCKVDVNQVDLTGPGSSEIFIFHTKHDANWKPSDGEVVFVQASRINRLPIFDEPARINEYPKVGFLVSDFKDLSALKVSQNKNYLRALSESLVQPEFLPLVRIDEASAGKLSVSIAARKSVFLPEGLDWQAASCEYHSR